MKLLGFNSKMMYAKQLLTVVKITRKNILCTNGKVEIEFGLKETINLLDSGDLTIQ